MVEDSELEKEISCCVLLEMEAREEGSTFTVS